MPRYRCLFTQASIPNCLGRSTHTISPIFNKSSSRLSKKTGAFANSIAINNERTRKRMKRFACWAALLSAVTLLGCAGAEGDSDRPATFPASGVITLDGSPVEGAQVAFNPEDPKGQGAFGRTDAEGRYELTTFETSDGAVPGKYIVTVTKYDVPPPMAEASEEEYIPPEAGGARPKAPKNELPNQYSQMHTSDLRAAVAADGENQFDFALTK